PNPSSSNTQPMGCMKEQTVIPLQLRPEPDRCPSGASENSPEWSSAKRTEPWGNDKRYPRAPEGRSNPSTVINVQITDSQAAYNADSPLAPDHTYTALRREASGHDFSRAETR